MPTPKQSVRKILLGILLLLPVSAMATKWIRLKGPDKNSVHAYDRDRLRTEGQHVTFWRLVRFYQPLPSEYGDVSRAIYQERIDCQTQMLQTLFVGLYDEERRPLLERANGETAPSAIILPESIGELFQSVVCRYVTLPSTPAIPYSSAPAAASGRASFPPVKIGSQPNTAPPFVPQRRPVIVEPNLIVPTDPDTLLPPSQTVIVPPAVTLPPSASPSPLQPGIPTPTAPIVPPLIPQTP